MGKRGFPPKSQALKVLSGQLPVTKENVSDLVIPRGAPKAPDHFGKEERDIWDRTIDLMHGCCVIEEIDVAVLGAYCDAFAKWQMAEVEIIKLKTGKRGARALIISGGNGNKTVHPWVALSRQAQKDMVYYAAQLGMTPAARLRVQVLPEKRDANPFLRLKDEKRLDSDSKGLRQIIEAEEVRAVR